ncbi:MAG: imidazole glycerol phosphate synthase subunit HisH [Zoogloeaceae bacterium]|jgi:glutamine amidotransferase|nr:imidazole glycerol phosphate synthase subunit HisH [Zoogloeaceae bacterium]
MRIAVIDYGMGNLRSVFQALARVAPGEEVRVTSDPAVVAAADRVVFPGQGAMPDCMAELDARKLRPAVLQAAAEKPFLGICIGLQMLFEQSEEGDAHGLGIFAGKVRRFPADLRAADGLRLKVPHMGWNQVRQQQQHPLWAGIADNARFYFVHSYCVQPTDPALTAGWCEYGQPFTCAAGRANIFAVQFHPEKSARDGLQLLQNFVSWQP